MKISKKNLLIFFFIIISFIVICFISKYIVNEVNAVNITTKTSTPHLTPHLTPHSNPNQTSIPHSTPHLTPHQTSIPHSTPKSNPTQTPDSSCVKNCSGVNCGDSDGCGNNCSKCSENCFCTPGNVCSYNYCLYKRPLTLCEMDGRCGSNIDGNCAPKCGVNTDDTEGFLGGSCNCLDGNWCNQGRCVKISPTNGWDEQKIQKLTDIIYNFLDSSKSQTLVIGSMSYNYLCVTRKTALCIANSIANNYQYDPKYTTDASNLPSDSQKYINACLSNCLGVKGEWSAKFLEEIIVKSINKYDYTLEDNTDPVSFFQNQQNI